MATLASFERMGFGVDVDTIPEEVDPRERFDERLQEDIETLEKIKSGEVDWFTLRVRVSLAGEVLATDWESCLAFPSDRKDEVLSEPICEWLISDAIQEALEALENRN